MIKWLFYFFSIHWQSIFSCTSEIKMLTNLLTIIIFSPWFYNLFFQLDCHDNNLQVFILLYFFMYCISQLNVWCVILWYSRENIEYISLLLCAKKFLDFATHFAAYYWAMWWGKMVVSDFSMEFWQENSVFCIFLFWGFNIPGASIS